MTQVNPYITFNGKCREALTFYQKCLGGELSLLTVKDSPMADQFPAELQSNILHGSLSKDGRLLFATDMVGKDKLVNGNTISLSLTCSSEVELKTFFSNLSMEGKITQPLHDFFDGTIGSLIDKFENNWMFYYNKK